MDWLRILYGTFVRACRPFSSPKPPFSTWAVHIAEAMDLLMRTLGYVSFVAQAQFTRIVVSEIETPDLLVNMV